MMTDVSAGTFFGYKPPLLVSWNRSRREARTYSFSQVDFGKGISDGTSFARSNESRDFMPVTQEHERGPELDLEGASQGASARIGNLNVSHARMSGECGRQK